MILDPVVDRGLLTVESILSQKEDRTRGGEVMGWDRFPRLLVLVILAGLAGVWILPVCAGQESAHLPAHVNHTWVDRYFSQGSVGFRVLAIGDVLGSREVIVWMEFCNNGSSPWVVSPGNLFLQGDDGLWRIVVYTSWSQITGSSPIDCGEMEWIWCHPQQEVGPSSTIQGWAVFWLPKRQFEDLRVLRIQYVFRDQVITGNVTTSPSRIPEDLPYLTVRAPRDGQVLAALWNVRFDVADKDVGYLISVKWWVELDGKAILAGTASKGSGEVCPIWVETGVGPLSVPDGPHRLLVTVEQDGVNESASVDFILDSHLVIPQLEVKWAFNTSAQFPGKTFGAGHQCAQTVWDIDKDGFNEIIFGTRKGDSKRTWCIKADGKTVKWIFPPLAQDPLPGDMTTKMDIVDVNNDGTYELLMGNRHGHVYCLKPDGSILWQWDDANVGSAVHGAVQAVDVDKDGLLDLFCQDNAGYVYRLTNMGKLVWQSFKVAGANEGQTTLADIDRDGEYDVLWASQDHNVYCISALTGGEKWRFDTGANQHTNQVFVADVNKDGEYEAIAWNALCRVFCISSYGKEIWSWENPKGLLGRIALCQAMGDVDGDGSMDMAVMSDVGAYVIDIGGVAPRTKYVVNFTDMSLTGLIPPGGVTLGFTSYQLIADIDGDDKQEILWLAPFPIVVDGATGDVEAYYLNGHVQVNARQENGGWWGDVDNDGRSEWIVELNGKSQAETMVYCLTLNGKFPAESPWPEYYHCAYPASYQDAQSWITLKASGSNSLWFPIERQIPEIGPGLARTVLSVATLSIILVVLRTNL